MQEKENIIRILKETKKAVEKQDNIALKNLSNQTIHTASAYQDADNITVAVIIYALSKILERTRYREYGRWPSFFKNFMSCINKAISAVEKDDIEGFREQIRCIRKGIDSLTGNFKMHIQDVFRKAEISKASRIYEHGISMEQTSKLLGITLWELADYAGQTGISEVNLNITLPEKTRIKQALEIFER